MAIKIILLLLPLAAILVTATAAIMPTAMSKSAGAGGDMHKMFFRHRVFPPYLGGRPGLTPGGGLGGGSGSSSGGDAGAGSGGPGGAGKFSRGIRAAGVAVAGDVKMGAAFPAMP